MSLHVEVIGRGPNLVMLHGWAMHGGIWHGVAERLAAHFCVHLVDLPGHGHSTAVEPFGLNMLAERVAAEFPWPVHVLGWSLGGAVALRWALDHPTAINKLVLVASSPCFAQRPDWPSAMKQEVLAGFASNLQADYEGTLKRFLALQAMGGQATREVLRALQDKLFERGRPDGVVLGKGLDILRDVDMRHELQHLDPPTLLIYGERDGLTPAPVGRWLAANLPDAELMMLKHSAHAPFISHPDHFAERVIQFLS
ncbi:pimeloyl-ACP methyl ester esterase BioH [Chitinivorax sp. B]|uniref:pimeloyl-ACP methyl ester esterase BioH n=1 Tax=Chitinivorax sp. B TaxID=2502235 RepID=UPI0010F7FB7F|nr:pimeloyl-ACP methyl ester esterase BioH [Chitinivorax sp. B]